MKIRNIFILITALCLTAFILSACGYLDGSEQGSININFDNSGARAIDKTGLIYTITLTSPGKDTITKTTKEGETSISIPVSEGAWKIDVQAEGSRVRGVGDANVAVTAGKPAPANIKMRVTGTRVSSWDELKEDFEELNNTNGKLKDLYDIEIIAPELDASTGLSLTASKKITLWAKNNVTITRGINQKNAPVFTIKNCILILDGIKNGKITIDGNMDEIAKVSDNPSTRALINVEKDSTLIIGNGVTLTNNISGGSGGKGGGIYVNDGTFIMNGGTISKNKATANGGGVYITNGSFIKTGGIIYGNDVRDDSNFAGNSNSYGAGDAVYFDKGNSNNSIFINYTLGPDKDENGNDI